MKYDALIIGGGIVGLATAYQLQIQKPHWKIALIEKEKQIARHQTGNNSGVIHSGIYYKPGSLKAKNCIEGYERLLDFCRTQEVNFELCGKVIVATSKEDLPTLDMIYQRGLENGLSDLAILNQAQLKEREPHVNGIAGILVPQTGIIDYKAVSQKLAELFKQKGGSIFLGEEVTQIRRHNHYTEVVTDKQSQPTKLLINCAGLYSDRIAEMSGSQLDLRIIPFRGEYYKLVPERRGLVKHLIYPVPDPAFPFLGVHFTRMINGGIEAGPNAVLAYSREGYSKSKINFKDLVGTLQWRGFRKIAAKYWKTGAGEFYRSYSKDAFTKALQKLIPEIKAQDLMPGGAGVRAQACDKNGGLLDDFSIVEQTGIIHVCNAPSPAATSCLAIGHTIAQKAIAQQD
ncbi:MAG: L-2-hydroxyglutarate oxidase [Bernardetiaceae bacterium]|nr:L-2-hydroxyglutarate oxidase [Bernardetiaceae bacterium]